MDATRAQTHGRREGPKALGISAPKYQSAILKEHQSPHCGDFLQADRLESSKDQLPG